MKKKNIWLWLLSLFGWKTTTFDHPTPPKSVICVAPHTSNRDFYIGFLYYMSLRRGHPRFMIKKEWFVFPLNLLFKALGGVAIDRKKSGSTIVAIADGIKASDRLYIGITPEGSRSRRERWKSGFYHIAVRAEVPIELARIDYQKREVGIFGILYPSGNAEEEIPQIRHLYNKEMARFPEKFAELSE